MCSIIFPVIRHPQRRQPCFHGRGQDSFLDLWRLLGEYQPLYSPLHLWGTCAPKTNSRAERMNVPKQPWVHRLRIKGYDPRDIDVKVDGDRVIVHAIHVEKSGENEDRHETKRIVSIPDNVHKERIGSFLLDDGHFVITAPYKEEQGSNTENAKTERNIGIQQENLSSSTNGHEMGINCEGQSPTSVVLPSEELTVLQTEVENECTNKVEDDKQHEADRSHENYGEEIKIKDVIENNKENVTSLDSKSEEKETRVSTSSTERELLQNGFPNEGDDTSLDDSYIITSPLPSPVHAKDNGQVFMEPSVNGEIAHKNDEALQVPMEKSLSPLMDAQEFVEVDGQKKYEVSINLENFKPEHVAVRFKDNLLSIDAEREVNSKGVFTAQKVHRKFLVPENGDAGQIMAKMNDEGFMKISVPLRVKQLEDTVEERKD